jgi:serine/threonine protein kinase
VNFDALLRELARAPDVPIDKAAVDPFPIGARVGPYCVVRRIGSGGMGVVYLATDTRLERRVALKAFKRGRETSLESERESMLREAKHAAGLNHPAIAALYDVGESDGIPFIAMEYIEGVGLRDALPRSGFGLERTLAIATDLAGALAHAHAFGVVHRDLKPENLILTPTGSIKILDFGLAAPSPQLTARRSSGPSGGTPPYMSPEQIGGGELDVRTDVFAFGILFHELVTGHRPRSKGRDDSISRPVSRFIARCSAHDPKDRLEDGAAVVRALEELRSNLRNRSTFRRYAAVTLAGGALLALSIAIPHPSAPALRKVTSSSAEVLIRKQAISPTGDRIVYAEQRGLFLSDLSAPSRMPQPLVTTPPLEAQHVFWWPDERFILVGGRARGRTDGSNVWKVDATSGIAEPMFAFDHVYDAKISHDGKHVAVAVQRELRVAPTDRLSALESIRTLPDAAAMVAIAWEDDDARIDVATIWTEENGRRGEIESVDLASRRVVRRVADDRLVQEIGEVAFDSAGEDVIYALAPWVPHKEDVPLLRRGPGTEARVIATWPGFVVSSMTLDRAHQHLSFLRYENQSDVYVGRMNGARGPDGPALERLTFSEMNELPSSWSLDGASILIVSDANGGEGCFRQTVDGGFPVLISRPEEWDTWPKVVGKDQGVLYWHIPERPGPASRATLVFVRPDGERKSVLETEPMPIKGNGRPPPSTWWVRCVAADSRCILGHVENKSFVLESVDPVRQVRAPVARIPDAKLGYTGFALSPEGDRIAFAESDGSALDVFRLTGELEERRSIPGVYLQFADFTKDGRDLIVTGVALDPGNTARYRVYRLGPGSKAEILWTTSAGWFTHPLVGPDNNTVALSVMTFKTSVWVADLAP